MLKFSPNNAKTKKLAIVSSLSRFLDKRQRRKIFSFDLPSGYSCPFAKECLSKAVVSPNGGAWIQDGKDTKFRCFSASQEVIYPKVRELRWRNFNTLRKYKTQDEITNLLLDSLPHNLGICRLHVAGDFYNQAYFNAWLNVANQESDRLFYAYTKSLVFWISRMDNIPPNMVLTASYGGRYDELIKSYGLRSAKVVFSEREAKKLHLEIDHDDSHAADPLMKDIDFALLIHGVQPAGSKASKAVSKLRGKGSYGRK